MVQRLTDAISRQTAAPSQRLLAVLASVIVLLGVMAYVLSPFRATGGLKCGPALFGSSPREDVTFGLLVNREDQVCQEKGNSRLIVGGFAAVLALAVGLGAVFLPAGPTEQAFTRRD